MGGVSKVYLIWPLSSTNSSQIKHLLMVWLLAFIIDLIVSANGEKIRPIVIGKHKVLLFILGKIKS